MIIKLKYNWKELNRGVKLGSMFNADIEKYPLFFFDLFDRTLKPIPAGMVESVSDYNHDQYQLHHFIEKQIRKNNPEYYARIEYLQKLILVPAQMNYDASSGMSEENFLKNWGIEKYKIIFMKDRYSAGFYD